MATLTKCEDFVLQLATGTHNFTAAGDTFRAVIHSDAMDPATNTGLSDLTQVTGTGYTAGGEDIQNDLTETGGTATATAVDVTWTATAGDWTAGRYVSIYNDTAASNNLFGSYDYGSNFTVGNGETFTLDFGASLYTLT